MLMLRQKWGLFDTEDAVGGAKALAALGYADPQRIVVMGGSAGGYTVLNALEQFPGVFKAGIDLFRRGQPVRLPHRHAQVRRTLQ
jgi:dipeptidyl aminopeptidase/acylaminoacyl peptidase